MGPDTINLIISLAVFVIGTLFGSFFSLATYRIPRKQDITHTRSYCPKCKHKLGFFDCFPILSYVSTIGRCRYCKCYISYRYPLTELASGFFFLLAYLFLGLSSSFYIILACYVYLFLVIGSDIMKSKMTEEEKKEVEEIAVKKIKKNIRLSKKSGALNTEIVIAVIVFIMYFITTIYVTANYRGMLEEYRMKSTALNICSSMAEGVMTESYASLQSQDDLPIVSGCKCKIEVQPFMKDGYIEVPTAKDVKVIVTYEYNGEQKSVSISLIREEVTSYE